MLRNTRIYIVEGEPIVALEMQQELEDAGAIARAFTSLDEARRSGIDTDADLVILDARQGAPDVVAFVAALHAAGVATVVATADNAIGPVFGNPPLLEKPFLSADVVAACERALISRPPRARTHEAPL